MTSDCYHQLAQSLQRGAVVLATVTHVVGSVPREVGAKMVITADGQTFNTIGGGAGEAKVIRQAMTVLETGEKQPVEIDLSGAPHRETQGICGGRMQVWLERWQGEAAIALVQRILEHRQRGQPITLVTPFAPHQAPYIQNDDSWEIPAPTEAFVETIQPPPLLLIVGAGHVGEQLAIVAHLAGFQIAVQDSRPEWANTQRFTPGTLLFTDSMDAVMLQLANHRELYVALVTRGYQHDLEALHAVVKREPPCHYIGMIGSQKRVRQVLQAAEQAGISPLKLQTIYAPIGLDIGAQTPEEIAISIAAELIMVRHQGSGQPLSTALVAHATKTSSH